MEKEIREIRTNLNRAYNVKDWWAVKKEMDRIDTLLNNIVKSKLTVSQMPEDDYGSCMDCGRDHSGKCNV